MAEMKHFLPNEACEAAKDRSKFKVPVTPNNKWTPPLPAPRLLNIPGSGVQTEELFWGDREDDPRPESTGENLTVYPRYQPARAQNQRRF